MDSDPWWPLEHPPFVGLMAYAAGILKPESDMPILGTTRRDNLEKLEAHLASCNACPMLLLLMGPVTPDEFYAYFIELIEDAGDDES